MYRPPPLRSARRCVREDSLVSFILLYFLLFSAFSRFSSSSKTWFSPFSTFLKNRLRANGVLLLLFCPFFVCRVCFSNYLVSRWGEFSLELEARRRNATVVFLPSAGRSVWCHVIFTCITFPFNFDSFLSPRHLPFASTSTAVCRGRSHRSIATLPVLHRRRDPFFLSRRVCERDIFSEKRGMLVADTDAFIRVKCRAVSAMKTKKLKPFHST